MTAASRAAAVPGFDPEGVATVLRALLPAGDRHALHEPCFAGREWDYVKDCLDTGWVSSVGAYVDRFEHMLAERCGVARAIAVVNGTAGLHIALRLAGVRAGDEVLVPTLTFVATANAVSYCGAVPHLVDSCPTTLGLDPRRLDRHLATIAATVDGQTVNRDTGRPLRAVVPMHVFGHPVDMDGLAEVAARWRLVIVEDAAEALGSLCHGRPIGSFGEVGVISFNGNKVVTTGGGGAILTNRGDLADAARHLTTTAKLPHPWAFDHDQLGYNYRLPNLNAALGCAQVEQLDGFIAAKRRLARLYQERLGALPGIEVVAEPAGCRSIYWLNAVLTPDAASRDALLRACHERGLMVRPAWSLMHRLPMYRECPRADLSVAEALEARMVCLPSGVALARAVFAETTG